jgi:four helix bundle protein
MQDYKKLVVWAKAHQLVLRVHCETDRWRRRSDASLASQLRRAAAAVPANIAEGCHRRSRAEFRRYLEIAFASAGEVDYHLLLARDTGVLAEDDYRDLQEKTEQVKRMLAGLSRRLTAAIEEGR